jgi:hypothetical protein
MEYERIREQAAKVIHDAEFPSHSWLKWERWKQERYLETANAVLSLKLGSRTLKELIELHEQGKVRVETENQDLPKNPYTVHTIRYANETFEFAQKEMLTPDSEGNVWVKCLKKDVEIQAQKDILTPDSDSEGNVWVKCLKKEEHG